MRCQPGDLALVIAGDNVGAFVDVLRLGENHPIDGRPAWECRIKAEMMVTSVDMKRRRIMGQHRLPAGEIAMFCDDILWPIRPPKTPQAIPAPELETTL